MKAKRLTSSDIDNIKTESFLYQRFKLLALNMFKYGGLDDLNIEDRHIEEYLFSEGQCIWFEDPNYGLMCLRGMGLGSPNVMEDPVKYRVTGFNYTREIPADKCVRMGNNKLFMPTATAIEYFVNQLYEVVRTRDTNIKTLKLPFIMATNDKEVLTAKKILEEIEKNSWAVVVNKTIVNIDEAVKVLPTGVKPYTAELTDQYHDILNEALTYLGINNANTDKKERLITSEANANNQFIESCAEMFLESRRAAVEKINKMFGTNITVELRNKQKEVEYEEEPIQEPATRDE